jgi:hypothetical protein
VDEIMTCVHLRKLYQLCLDHDLKLQLSGSDLVRIVCRQCGVQEVCPSMLTDEYDAKDDEKGAEPPLSNDRNVPT